MPSLYIQASEYGLYGLPATTTSDQVIEASTILDAWMARPEGLVGVGQDPILEYASVTRRGWIVLTRAPIYAVDSIKYRLSPRKEWVTATYTAENGRAELGLVLAPEAAPRGAEVKVSYRSGYARASLPVPVKLATAALVTNLSTLEDVPAAAAKAQAGDAAIQLFTATRLDNDIKALVAPWRRVV